MNSGSLVSHDRTFLDRLSSETWEIEGGKFWRYPAAYSRAPGTIPPTVNPPHASQFAIHPSKALPHVRQTARSARRIVLHRGQIAARDSNPHTKQGRTTTTDHPAPA